MRQREAAAAKPRYDLARSKEPQRLFEFGYMGYPARCALSSGLKTFVTPGGCWKDQPLSSGCNIGEARSQRKSIHRAHEVTR